ncbi:MAG: hypothetical protein OXL97_04760 [Chloroflexota bacterium]|nr:hypothetical protein [Chloroflexota bacterium]MDE2884759.1 hypothetical protein [Chloroflexota bacterium]
MRTRLLLSVIGLGALFTVLLTACGEDPTPTPTPVPATPTPTPEAMPHPPVTLNFQGTARTWGEILEGMNKILEANDSFIERITILDVNPDNAMRAWADMSAEERKYSLIYGLENNVDVNEAGLHPIFADSPLPSGLKAVMSNGPLGCSGHGTWDVDLLSLKDTAGKKVDMDSEPIGPVREEIMRGLGVLDSAEITFLGAGPRTVETLKNRNVDVDIIHLTGATRPIPPHIQILTEEETYIVDVTAEGIDAAVGSNPDVFKSMYPFPLYEGDLADSLGLSYNPVREPVVYCIGGQNPHILAGEEVDSEIIEELVRVILENKDDFHQYVTGDVDSLIDGLPLVVRPKSGFHSGAQAAYESLGVPYGVNAMVEIEQQRAQEHGQEFYMPDYLQDRLE